MQELAERLNHTAETHFSETGSVDALDETAQKWATYCLKEMRGNTLARGLDVSRALAEFVAELKHPTG